MSFLGIFRVKSNHVQNMELQFNRKSPQVTYFSLFILNCFWFLANNTVLWKASNYDKMSSLTITDLTSQQCVKWNVKHRLKYVPSASTIRIIFVLYQIQYFHAKMYCYCNSSNAYSSYSRQLPLRQSVKPHGYGGQSRSHMISSTNSDITGSIAPTNRSGYRISAGTMTFFVHLSIAVVRN